jgi:hypothetical protein
MLLQHLNCKKMCTNPCSRVNIEIKVLNSKILNLLRCGTAGQAARAKGCGEVRHCAKGVLGPAHQQRRHHFQLQVRSFKGTVS